MLKKIYLTPGENTRGLVYNNSYVVRRVFMAR
jgi:hypothetical protein